MLGAVGFNPGFGLCPAFEAIDRLHRLAVPRKHFHEKPATDPVLANLVCDASGRLLSFPCFDDSNDVVVAAMRRYCTPAKALGIADHVWTVAIS
jgi:hypothetical protein